MKTIAALLVLASLAWIPGWRPAPALADEQFLAGPRPKDDGHVGMNPGRPDGREGGETFADAVPILELPFHDTGNTSDNIDNYGTMCPYGSMAPDVVYSFQPAEDTYISIDLCLSLYDTAIFVWDIEGQLVDCNDDFYYNDPVCMNYRSKIEELFVPAGELYYITVDGYSSDSGEYDLVVEHDPPPEPCHLVCGGVPEGEPPLGGGYVDLYNSGCNDTSGLLPFQSLEGDENGELVFCGVAGWYDGSTRDTDWFLATIGPSGLLEWTVTGEQETRIFLLGPQDCSYVGVLQDVLIPMCESGAMQVQGDPGEVVWLWAGASVYSPPAGFSGHEFTYVASFTGLEPGTVPTRPMSFDGIKSLYR